jgi:hypothetical protein
MIERIASAAHDLNRTKTVWSEDSVSVSWDLGEIDSEGESPEPVVKAKAKATLVSWFEDTQGKLLRLDSKRAAELWSGSHSGYGTKCPQQWMDRVFGQSAVVQHRILCISKE